MAEANFKHDGEIMDVYVSPKQRLNKKFSFGFVRFKKEADALNAIRRNNGLEIRGRRILVSMAKFRKPNTVAIAPSSRVVFLNERMI